MQELRSLDLQGNLLICGFVPEVFDARNVSVFADDGLGKECDPATLGLSGEDGALCECAIGATIGCLAAQGALCESER